MKKNPILMKTVAGVLLAAVFAFTFVLPVPVRSTGFTIDDSVFSSYDVDHMTAYYWRPGIPPTKKDGTKYPMLITWDDGKYYFAIGQEFFNKEKGYSDLRSNNSDLPIFSANYPSLNITRDNGWYPKMWIGSDGWVGNQNAFPKGYPYGYYRYTCSYPSAEEGMTAKLPFDFGTLDQQERMISLELPNVPNFVGQGKEVNGEQENNNYIMVIDVPESLRPNNRYYSTNHKYALLRSQLTWDEFDNSNGSDFHVAGKIKDYFNWHFKPLFTDSLTDLSNLYELGSTEAVSAVLGDFKWTCNRANSFPEYCYSMFTAGDWEWNGDESAVLENYESMMALLDEITDRCFTRMEWKGSTLRTQGNGNEPSGDNSEYINPMFKFYYATPVIMDIIQTSFTVEKGQVANLDGPILIGNNCTITVKEGGTLTISAKSEANGVDLGWVMNNGKIVVEKGGTLYLQKGACLNKYNNKNSAGGGVISSGLVIVDENAKLCGGGLDGLQFKNGSHVVNYGAIISENFLVEKDHTIENRGEKAVVFHGKGNGIVGSGYSLFSGEVTSSGYPERGKVEETVLDSIATNGIYTW